MLPAGLLSCPFPCLQGMEADAALDMMRKVRPIVNPYMDCWSTVKQRLLSKPPPHNGCCGHGDPRGTLPAHHIPGLPGRSTLDADTVLHQPAESWRFEGLRRGLCRVWGSVALPER